MPDRDISPGAADAIQRVSVGVKVFHAPTDDSGLAFAPGSRFHTPEERKPIQTPGLSVTVPIQ
ncbi:hypothetical protein [Rhodopila sp.]|uniref:hypothetical protein n=1 Tax=Rhodopila sp. TaxID=2480087 RepID=UPI002C40D552|nr:hypothetical protein [Rhodopila sp.]HVZ09417.1 hypothetical protein [Rhodopila sp.]